MNIPNRSDFIAAFEDEIVGLVMMAYHNAQRLPPEHRSHGKYIHEQIVKSQALLGKIHDRLNEYAAKTSNGKPFKERT